MTKVENALHYTFTLTLPLKVGLNNFFSVVEEATVISLFLLVNAHKMVSIVRSLLIPLNF